ncbi:hsdA domain protein [Escherichia coli 2-005-03_S1_C2]|nr:hsdA domain protein [Escherichia coli 2-005-03_S1_C3]EZK31454.1 hsdA domain protein [Escherichia coli 2-005-03_S1_C2]EZK42641.1 hsdA domain protein [Escherichia coli 2-005-03_S1_C1]KDA62674.1 hsdA domain protein [Escherichia coli 2-052-05_S1_C1]KDT11766.1 hsdA domain protein [Escherichia coli 2-052-05_S1_C3]KDW39257.1 hsdA domain protein [Escherichia coli 2-177-06_S1_C3]
MERQELSIISTIIFLMAATSLFLKMEKLKVQKNTYSI